jgi:hypothetical protein
MNKELSDREGDPRGSSMTSQAGEAGANRGTDEGATERTLKEAVGEDLSELRQFADEQTAQAKTAVSRAVEDDKNMAAQQLSGVATALKKVGAELEQSDQRAIGRYAKQMGRSLQGFARDVEGRDLGEIAGMAEDFGRKQPLAFLGIAAIAGFAASRFLTASVQRQRTSRPQDVAGRTSQGGPQPMEDRYNG